VTPAAAAALVRELGLEPHAAAHGLVNAIAADRGLTPPWDADHTGLPVLDDVNAIGDVHQLLLGNQDAKRGEQGSYYTPDPLTQFMSRFVMDINLTRLGDQHPLDMLILDPSCGAGAMLVRAARALTTRLIEVDLGCEPTEYLIRGLLPHLVGDCIFGVDIDPVAVDLTKSALWLEANGVPDITWMDRNIICGNTLDGDEPPKLRERQATVASVCDEPLALFETTKEPA
jgi:type I restriction-modification system DNA methylase subunit